MSTPRFLAYCMTSRQKRILSSMVRCLTMARFASGEMSCSTPGIGANLVVDGQVLDDGNLAELERLRHDLGVHVELQVEGFGISPHVVERDVGIFGHFDDGRERMQVPEGERVEALPRHLVKK